MTYGKHRLLEMIPALLVWGTFVLALVLSFLAPIAAIVFVIIFDVYWMWRVLYFIVFVLRSWRQHRLAERVNWMEKLKREVDDWEQYWHVIFLPTYKEPLDVLDQTLASLKRAHYPGARMVLVLAGEERDEESFLAHTHFLQKKYAEDFAEILVTVHPAGLPDEIPGKGSNLHFAGPRAAAVMAERGVDPDRVIVSSFDVDTVAHPDYFAHLTWTYATVEDPTRASYQPVVLFNNNVWESPAPVRVMAFGTTFWLLGELARPERLWTFSSHAMSLRMLIDVGYWQKDIVSEDSRIFLQGVVHYGGAYRVEPLALPVSMDAVASTTYWESVVALYKQQRRWAWGVEHFPYLIEKVWKHPQIPASLKRRLLWNHLEGMYTWATAPILIFLLGWLPARVAEHHAAAFVHNTPFTLDWIMRVAALGMFVSGAVSLSLLPPRPATASRWRWVAMFAQWILLPITFIALGALPAIDAQTRMALGKYLGFNVTKKTRAV